MPLGGETIGRAYVKILADGSGFSDDVKRQMRENDPGFDAAGKKSSRDFWDGYNEEQDKQVNTSMRDLKRRMERSTGRFQASGDLLGGEFMEGLRGHLERQFKDVGTVIYANLNDELESGRIDFTGLMHQLEDLRPLVAKATKDIAADQKHQFDDLDHSIRRYGEGLDKSGRSRQDFLRDLRAQSKILAPTTRGYAAFNATISDLRKIVGNAAPKMARFKDDMNAAGETVGRVFGKGSRNNFINWFGSLMGAVGRASRIMSSFTKWPGLVAEQIGRMAAKFQGAIDEAGSLRGALLNLAQQGLPGLVAALVTVSATVQFVGGTLGIFSAALSLASGWIIAVAGSLSFALVGGLVAVAGALVPAALGIGALIIGIKELNKKSQAFKDLKKEWKDFRAEVGKAVFGKDAGGLRGVTELLKTMRPLMVAAGGAIRSLLGSFEKNVKTKEFRDMIADITRIVPGMIKQLGRIAGNILLSVGEAFVAAEPLISDFLGWLDDITQAMADSGKGGKDSPMADFFKKAGESAKAVGGFILETIGLIGDLFSAGKGTGDSVFKTLTDNVKDFRKWLQKAKEDGSLQKFFDDAKRFGDKLGEIVVNVGELIAALDTDTNRSFLFTLLDVINQVLDALTAVSGKAGEAGEAIKTKFEEGVSGAKTAIEKIKSGETWNAIKTKAGEAVDGIVEFFDGLGEKIAGFLESLPDKIATYFSGLSDKIVTAAGNLDDRFNTWISGVGAAVSLWPGKIAAYFTGLATKVWFAAGDLVLQFDAWVAGLPVKAINAVGNIVVGWLNLAGRMITAAGNIVGGFTQWLADLPGRALQGAVNIVAAFANLAIRIVKGAGNLAAEFGKWAQGVPARLKEWALKIPGQFTDMANKIIARAGNLGARFSAWASSLPGRARAFAAQIAAGFTNLAGKIIARAGSIYGKFNAWWNSLPGKATAIAGRIAVAFVGLAGKAIAKAGSIVAKIGTWASGVKAAAGRVADRIVDAFSGLASRIINAIGTIIPKFKMPHISIPKINSATGGIFSGAQTRIIGEAGPEAVVPLRRSLNQVDPAVRELSAIAQGLKVPNMASGGGNVGRQIDVGGITIITPTEDPRGVASEVVARMAAASYL